MDSPELWINKDSQFFISLAQSGLHSFLMLGVIDSAAPILLADFGKIVPERDDASPCDCCFACCCQHPALLENEGLTFRYDFETDSNQPKKRQFNHLSFALSYSQYLRFIQLLEYIDPDFAFYKPERSQETSDEIKLTMTNRRLFSAVPPPSNYSTIKARTQSINFFTNSCRHSALEIIKATLSNTLNTVSTNFWQAPPLKAQVSEGKIISETMPFYLLPLPPSAYPCVTAATTKILEDYYQRLTQMLRLSPESPATKRKFALLKQHYQAIADDSTLDAHQLLKSIRQFKQNNFSDLNTLRQRFFFDNWLNRQSATIQLLENIEHSLTT